MMNTNNGVHITKAWTNGARVDADGLRELDEAVDKDPLDFWSKIGLRLEWIRPFSIVKDVSFKREDFRISWFADGILNAAVNCLDRHLPQRGETIALIWEGDDPKESRRITYTEAHAETCRMANILRSRGVRKGDRVSIYLPMIPEAAFAMLACARIGAIHSVIFGGFSSESIAQRVQDCGSRVIITANQGLRNGKVIPLKDNIDRALRTCPDVETVIVIRRTVAETSMLSGRDIYFDEARANVSAICHPEPMRANDPLFILYTSGSTGKPKGVVHSTGGYLAWASWTHEIVFDYRSNEVYWCTADIGWITGHSYIVYGPLANGATSLIFEGVPTYPDLSRLWQVVDKHRVRIFYTAPTVLRTLMREGDKHLDGTSRDSLRLLGSVGEPINPEVWLWYYRVVGKSQCPVVDTWWQTETGGLLICPLPGANKLKPGSASKPLPGIKVEIVDRKGEILEGIAEGNLCLTDSGPGQMVSIYGDHNRFFEAYFSAYPGKYFSGDGCRRDSEGDYWITGRVDDVINVSGHRLSSAEIESALVAHPSVAEAAAVAYTHEIKGQGIYAYVTLNSDRTPSDELYVGLVNWVRTEIGPFAAPDVIHWAPSLPKTRSEKILRRILRKVAENDVADLGDTSTLADPSLVDDLIKTATGASRGPIDRKSRETFYSRQSQELDKLNHHPI
jgi:acetyl-CoA synthetase